MDKKIIEFGMHDWIYGRLECMANGIGVPIEIVINNWLMKGCNKDWRVFTSYIKNLDREKVQGDELHERLDDFFTDLAEYYYKQEDNSKEFGFQERFIEEHFDFLSFEEEDEFRRQYFSESTKKRQEGSTRYSPDDEEEED
jgi:hypothetical protein